jgi:hypothetical protein
MILARDPICRLQTNCHGAPSREVDHVGRNDDHSLENLRGVCAACHRHRTSVMARASQPNRKREPESHPGFV